MAVKSGITGDISRLSLDLPADSSSLTVRSPQLLGLLTDFIAIQMQDAAHYDIVIAGPGAIGKSELAKLLHERIAESTYLPLDASVLEAAYRDAHELNGYQYAAYNAGMVQDWIRKLKAEESFLVAPFDHTSRGPVGQLLVDGAARVRIVEWVFALHPDVALDADLRIVLDADEVDRYRFLTDRFFGLRHAPLTQQTWTKLRKRLESTRREVDATLQEFDVRLVLDGERRITQLHCDNVALNRHLQQHLEIFGAVTDKQRSS